MTVLNDIVVHCTSQKAVQLLYSWLMGFREFVTFYSQSLTKKRKYTASAKCSF